MDNVAFEQTQAAMAMSKSAALSTAASVAASAVLIRTLTTDLVPAQLRDYFSSSLIAFLSRFSSQVTITIDAYDGPIANHMFRAAETYLATKLTPSTRRIRVTKQEEDSDEVDVTMDRGEEVVDHFEGMQFKWQLAIRETAPRRRYQQHRNVYTDSTSFETKYFELTFHKKHKDAALKSYLPFVLARSKAIKEAAKTLQLYTNEDESWTSVNMRHPATFETLAMDGELKREVMEDLARFVKRKEYYKRVGKAWKRGYLLYGPPGTGKSSLVAAMANLLRFDVYDLELTEVRNNSALRSLLVGTSNRSILVVEDIDCSADLGRRENKKGSRNKGDPEAESEDEKVTLSGLLNSVDGLWSSCGDERIIVFTTNHKDRLDPALLRPGRMDMHVHMNYCTPSGFRVLASNYHYIDDDPLFGEIDRLIMEVNITPAEIAEELMKTDDAKVALQGLIDVLNRKKAEAIEADKRVEESEIANKGVEEKEVSSN